VLVRRGERGDLFCAGAVGDLAQAVRHVFQRGLPFDFYPLAVLLEHRLGQAFRRIQAFIAEAVLVGDPAFVDGFVLDRCDTHHLVVLHMHGQI